MIQLGVEQGTEQDDPTGSEFLFLDGSSLAGKFPGTLHAYIEAGSLGFFALAGSLAINF
jgi:hypothetical protein